MYASIIIILLIFYLPLKFLIRSIVMNLKEDEPCSDDEVYYGKLSLKELKHMFISNRQTITADEHREEGDPNASLKLISTHSEPDITSKYGYATRDSIPKSLSNTTLSPDEPNIFANWDVTSSENSFLKLEKMVENSCQSSVKEEFDNTLEEIEYILKNTPSNDKKTVSCSDISEKHTQDNHQKINGIDLDHLENSKILDSGIKGKFASNLKPSATITPIKQEQKDKELFATPSSVLRVKPCIYKTPANAPMFKKPSTSSLKKTPCKSNAFQHVASPVAYYINKSPQIPLIQNVHPKKTLPGLSSIPKLVKSTATKPSNKENISLPSVAYKSAKKTTVIDVTNGPKMPQSQWAKKLSKTLPRPAVLKHTHREKEIINKHLLRKPEDSFGDLSLQQADISVCTKKAAF